MKSNTVSPLVSDFISFIGLQETVKKFLRLQLSRGRGRSTRCALNRRKQQLSSPIVNGFALSVVAIKSHRHHVKGAGLDLLGLSSVGGGTPEVMHVDAFFRLVLIQTQ